MSRRWPQLLLAGAALAACTPAAAPEPPPKDAVDQVVRIFRGPGAPIATISRPEYLRAVARLRVQREDNLNAAPLSKQLREQLLEELIDERLLLMEATRLNVQASTVAAARELAGLRAHLPDRELQRLLADSYQNQTDLLQLTRRQLTILQLWERHLLPKVQVQEAELKAAFQALPKEARQRAKRVRARHILVDNKRKGYKLLRQLRQRTATFEQLAKAHSQAPEAARGGDLGWFEPGQLPSPFERCFDLKPGQPSKLITSHFGFHLFLVEAEQPARALSFDDLKPRLREQLMIDKLRTAKDALTKELRAQVQIKRDEVALARIETR